MMQSSLSEPPGQHAAPPLSGFEIINFVAALITIMVVFGRKNFSFALVFLFGVFGGLFAGAIFVVIVILPMFLGQIAR